ncbi:wax ester/triacylglycerol synthase family O-acyltransferase [Zhongshania guokunii]|uniref:diacylglycerol O-acyltransferase n=1 Tax=Zhongshania guokunii TaxID=641783 RepID=A0ABV3U3K9_9GAMM
MEQLTALDSQFLYTQTDDNFTHITVLLNFDGPADETESEVDGAVLCVYLQQKLQHHPIYRRRLMRLPAELDYPYWVDDKDFNHEEHFAVYGLNDPGGWRQLREAVSAIHSQPMDMTRPLWDVTLFTGVHCNGAHRNGFTIAMRLHHVAIDGIGITKLMAYLTSPESPAEALPTAAVLPWKTVAFNAASNRLRNSLKFSRSLYKSRSVISDATKHYLQTKPSERKSVPVCRFNTSVKGEKIFDVTRVNFSELNALRALHRGATVNDVVLAICAGALRRYLAHHAELPSQSLVAWVPVNARSTAGGNNTDSGNSISAFTAPIYTDIADPAARLAKIHAATQRGKADKAGAGLVLDLTKCLPATEQYLFSRALNASSAAASACNLFVSNVPGPAQPIKFAGHQLESMFGLPPLGEGMGLFIATPSYNGSLYFNVISTENILPDIEYFMTCIQASFADYQEKLASRQS